jgi:serine phosphatase RsbU (regulator of sigma subunit)
MHVSMAAPRLRVADLQGQRSVFIDKPTFLIGRRGTADLQINRGDVSREHARIDCEDGQYVISDTGSRFGTFVNGDRLTSQRRLSHGDRIRLGNTDSNELVFLAPDETTSRLSGLSTSGLGPLSAILNGLRAVGSGRVLDEVLTLVLDSALEVTSADRGFVMLATGDGTLEFMIGRDRSHQTLTGTSFATSGTIPREVFQSGETRIEPDLQDKKVADAYGHTILIGIRHVLCAPLLTTPYAAGHEKVARRAIGVLYLDGRERARIVSSATRASLEAFATQAALAIDSARLYAEAAEKTRLERDLRIAADIQRGLLPPGTYTDATCDLAAASIPCRTVGGDFYDYLPLGPGALGIALGDVAGKGPPAAILATAVQSNFTAHAPLAADPADLMHRLNCALLRRSIDARFATMCFGVVLSDGRFRYSNAGQEPPLVWHVDNSIEWLEVGGPVLGLINEAHYNFGEVQLASGDVVVLFSDGVTEARNESGEEYGRDRLLSEFHPDSQRDADGMLEQLIRSVRSFAGSAPQADDITALVLRYRPK